VSPCVRARRGRHPVHHLPHRRLARRRRPKRRRRLRRLTQKSCEVSESLWKTCLGCAGNHLARIIRLRAHITLASGWGVEGGRMREGSGSFGRRWKDTPCTSTLHSSPIRLHCASRLSPKIPQHPPARREAVHGALVRRLVLRWKTSRRGHEHAQPGVSQRWCRWRSRHGWYLERRRC
jgi:hypothetical protein